jgi:hypothetical protein
VYLELGSDVHLHGKACGTIDVEHELIYTIRPFHLSRCLFVGTSCRFGGTGDDIRYGRD